MLIRPALLIRFEQTVLLVVALFLYRHLHYSWSLFALLFLTPDLFILGYLINPRIGAATYNLVHTLSLPIALLLAAHLSHWALALQISLIWISHIAMDRLLGFGLKYPANFKDTHLQRL